MSGSTDSRRIVAVHLLNNFSGSPMVFAQALKTLADRGADIDLYSSGGPGFLSELPVNQQVVWYAWAPGKYRRLINYTLSQAILFVRMLRYARQDVSFYVNTLLPAGAALAGKLMGKKVIYHIHETHIDPPVFNRLLQQIVTLCATEVVYVSHFLQQRHPFPGKVIHNSLPAGWGGHHSPKTAHNPLRVLMISSLKKEKGIDVFAQLASRLPQMDFTLVIGSPMTEIEQYFSGQKLPANLHLHPATQQIKPYYLAADVIVNASDPVDLPETFGMTILEGMALGLPAIVPPVGGPAELVRDQQEGFHASMREPAQLAEALRRLAGDPALYAQCAEAARQRAKEFSPDTFNRQILSLFYPEAGKISAEKPDFITDSNINFKKEISHIHNI